VQNLTVTLTDVNAPPVFTSSVTASEPENTPATNIVYAAHATDAGEDSSTLTYSLSGPDSGLFTINGKTGEVTFKASPDFEAPADTNHHNQYQITVHANDGKYDVTKDVVITVTDVSGNVIIGTARADIIDQPTASVAALRLPRPTPSMAAEAMMSSMAAAAMSPQWRRRQRPTERRSR
jgi:hypothetical protein